jgi:two-component system OmpR family response regulator/two-component system response regulator QseB
LAKILLIDDDAAFGELTQRRLAKSGHEVTYQSQTEGALPAIASGQFHILMLDLGMPGLSGEDLLAVMRTTGQLDDKRVLLYSSGDPDRLKRLAQKFSVDALGKDASAEELRAKIDAILGEG